MFFVVRSNDSFNFPLGLIKYIVIVYCTGKPQYDRTAVGTAAPHRYTRLFPYVEAESAERKKGILCVV